MPTERRDPNSRAKLFVPSISEKASRSKQRKLNDSIKEIDQMKLELRELIEEAKKNNKK